jgi:hypothetical protein
MRSANNVRKRIGLPTTSGQGRSANNVRKRIGRIAELQANVNKRKQQVSGNAALAHKIADKNKLSQETLLGQIKK